MLKGVKQGARKDMGEEAGGGGGQRTEGRAEGRGQRAEGRAQSAERRAQSAERRARGGGALGCISE
jgi:hypothetical protein